MKMQELAEIAETSVAGLFQSVDAKKFPKRLVYHMVPGTDWKLLREETFKAMLDGTSLPEICCSASCSYVRPGDYVVNAYGLSLINRAS